jgi:hypothetical protein
MPTKQTFTAGQVLTAQQLTDLQDYIGVVQVLSTVKTDTFTTTSTTYVDITGLTVTITPTSASNKILVLAQVNGSSGTGSFGHMRLVRDSTAIDIGDAAASRTQASAMFGIVANASNQQTNTLVFLDSPATTSATVYKIQLQDDRGNTQAINRSSADTNNNTNARTASTITVMEVTP